MIKRGQEIKRGEFLIELRKLINRYSLENFSDTPDFVLADYLIQCLCAFENTTNAREKYYGRGSQQVPLPEQPKDTQ